jgi:hypothetical protein
MKNDIKKDNSLLPLCRQDIKKGKELTSKDVTPSTRCHWPPHHHRRRKHEQDQRRKEQTQQESARHRGRGRVGRQKCRGTQEAAHPAGCE